MADLLARIREHEKALAADTTKIIDLPRREGFVGARFACLDEEGMLRVDDTFLPGVDLDETMGGVDFLTTVIVEACVEIVAYDENAKVIPQADDLGPIKFDQRLAKLIGLDVPETAEPEEVVKALFTEKGRLNMMTLRIFGKDLWKWLAGVREDEDTNL